MYCEVGTKLLYIVVPRIHGNTFLPRLRETADNTGRYIYSCNIHKYGKV
jgi:hypothetical protein